MNERWQTSSGWWGFGGPCLLPAPKVLRSSCKPGVSTKAMSGAAAAEEGRAGGIFLSALHSHPCQSKTNLNQWERWFTMRKGFPGSLCVSPLDTWIRATVVAQLHQPGFPALSNLPRQNQQTYCLIFSS